MEKVLIILFLILIENNNFYKKINLVIPNNYDYIVNKNNILPENYVPEDLEAINLKYACKNMYMRKEAKINFERLAKDANKQGFNIIAASTYRSYKYQEELYNNYVINKGFYYADMASARPGHSEHQTGLSVDVADLSLDYDNFENTKEFNWMVNNSYKYGFILRYPKAKYFITGFKYEPWHYRYVGKEKAYIIYNNKLTLEEYKKIFNSALNIFYYKLI